MTAPSAVAGRRPRTRRPAWPPPAAIVAAASALVVVLLGQVVAQYAQPPYHHPVLDGARMLGVLGVLLGAYLWVGPGVTVLLLLFVGPLMPVHLPDLHGDEVHYLMISESLHRDGDFAVRDEYADQRLKPLNAGLPIEDHLGSKDGHYGASDYSVHLPGLGLIAYPGWTWHSRRLAMLGLCAAAVLLYREMVLLGRAWGASARAASLAATLLVLTQPLLLLSRQFFPEIPAALLLAHLARRLAERRPPSVPGWKGWIPSATVAAAAAFLPWVHVRLLPLAVLLLAALALRDRRMRVLPPVALAGSLALMAIVFQQWYGSPLPNAMYGGTKFSNPDPMRALLALLVDAHVGVLIVAPVAVVSLVAIPVLFRRARFPSLAILAVVAAAVLLDISYDQWHLGYSTPGRFWASLLPLGAPLVALALDRAPRTVTTVGLLGAMSTALLIAFPSEAYPDGVAGTSLWARMGIRHLPVLIPGGLTSTAKAGGLVLVVGAGLAVATVVLRRRDPGDESKQARTVPATEPVSVATNP